MARASARRSSFRDRIAKNSQKQRTKASSYGHLRLPRGINVFKEEPGTRVSLDFLPYVVSSAHHPDRDPEDGTAVEGSSWYRCPYKLHRNIGADNVSIVCPTSFGGKCPICEYRARLLAEGAKWNDKSVSGFKPSDRNLYYVVPRGVKGFDEKPHIWDISQFLFQAKLNNELEENEDFGIFPDLEEGLTLKIRFAEKEFVTPEGGKNKFAETSRIDFVERDYAYEEKTVTGLTSLDDVLDLRSYDDIKRVFQDQDEHDDDDSDAPATTTRRRREPEPEPEENEDKPAPTARRRRDPEPEPEDEPDDEPVEPTPAAVKPKRRDPEPPKRKAAASKDADVCPHGGRFGADNDQLEACDECKVWSACAEAQEQAARAAE